jgi:PAS domain S-box-containing protein
MLFRNLTTLQKGMVLVLVPLCFELLLLAVLANTLLSAERTLSQIDSSRRAVLQLQGFEITLVGAVLTVINSHESRTKQLAALDEMAGLIQSQGRLGNFCENDNPELTAVFGRVTRFSSQMQSVIQTSRRLLADHDMTAMERAEDLPKVVLMARVMELRKICRQIVQIENKVTTAEPHQLEHLRQRLIVAIGLGIAFSFILSFALAGFFTADILNRLRRINDHTRSLVARQSLEPPPEGRDEIAQLERSLYETSMALSDLQRKESAMLDNAVDVICSLDERLRFTGVNSAVARVWQYTPDELLGMSLMNMLEADGQRSTRDAFQQVAAGGGSGVVENHMRSKVGVVRNSQWRVKWSASKEMFFCVVHDVTELRAMEKLRRQFLSMVCHDLRSPIMSIGISLELLSVEEAASFSPDIAADLLRIKASSDGLGELTTEFLVLEKLESGLSVMNNRMVSLNDVCVVAAESVASMAQQAAVEIVLPGGDGTVWADEQRLVQAVSNLLNHAISLDPPGFSVKMAIAVSAGFVTLQIIESSVAAAGTGALIFEKFRKSQEGSKSGSGSGSEIDFRLAVVKAIIEGHTGKVGAFLDSSGGNCLWIRLPLYRDAGGDEP